MKRGRNQRRRQGANPNRALDSNGPDVRIRGTATQIYDKYQNLARDASSSGDRIKAESYLQHAEHYFRLIRAAQAANPQHTQQPQQAPQRENTDSEQPSVDNSEVEKRNTGSRPANHRNGPEKETKESEDAAAEAPVKEPVEASDSASEAADEEQKPRRRRARRPAKRAENDDAEKKEADESAAAAAE